MLGVATRIARLLPWVGLIFYGAGIYGYYSRWLDGGWRFKRPTIGFAVEDVLGFGFWPTWSIIAVLMAVILTLAYWAGLRRYLMLLIVLAFATLSVADYFLYGVLASQVPG